MVAMVMMIMMMDSTYCCRDSVFPYIFHAALSTWHALCFSIRLMPYLFFALEHMYSNGGDGFFSCTSNQYRFAPRLFQGETFPWLPERVITFSTANTDHLHVLVCSPLFLSTWLCYFRSPSSTVLNCLL